MATLQCCSTGKPGCQHHGLISHLVTLSWYWANQFLPYHNNAEPHESILKSLVWLDHGSTYRFHNISKQTLALLIQLFPLVRGQWRHLYNNTPLQWSTLHSELYCTDIVRVLSQETVKTGLQLYLSSMETSASRPMLSSYCWCHVIHFGVNNGTQLQTVFVCLLFNVLATSKVISWRVFRRYIEIHT